MHYYIENQTRLNATAKRALALADAQKPSLSDKAQRLIRAFAKLIAPADNQDSPDSPFRKAWSEALCEDAEGELQAGTASIDPITVGVSYVHRF